MLSIPERDGSDHRLVDGAAAVRDALRALVVRDVVGHEVEEVDGLPGVADVDDVLRGGEEPGRASLALQRGVELVEDLFAGVVVGALEEAVGL